MPAVTRSVLICRGLEEVAAYAGHVPHLTAWTTFFQGVGDPVDGRYPVDSAIGPIHTWIERRPSTAGARLAICSIIHEHQEEATIDLAATGVDATAVTFTVTLPDHLSPAVVDDQGPEMDAELAELKRLVEAQRAAA